MNSTSDAILERLASLSLEKCLLRLSRVSAGTWQVQGITVSTGTVADAVRQHHFNVPAAGVYFSLDAGSSLTALMLFNPADMECISKGFTGHSFPRSGHITPAEEIMLLELGNIVLNALTNSVLNALRKSSMPAVPQFVEGDADRVIAALGTVADLGREFSILKATLAIQCDKCVTTSEVIALVPTELAQEIERNLPA